MYWDYLAILILLAVVVPLVGRRRIERILRAPETTQAERLRIYASTIAFQWALTAFIVWRSMGHGIDTAALGLSVPWPIRTVIISVGLVLLILANQLMSLSQVGARPEELHSRLAQVALRVFPRDSVEKLIFFAVVSTVAVCEEVIFRGFAQRLFTSLAGFAVLGILLSAALFSFAHLYQGRRGLIATFIVGILFSVARYFSGSLVPCIAAHFATDLIAGYMFPVRLREALAREAAVSALPSEAESVPGARP
jgi:uncharacterized protein